MKGVIDRFTGGNQAVILVESMEMELVIPCDQLPSDAKANDWVILKEMNGHYEVVRIDQEKTAQQQAKIKSLHEQLKAKGKSSRFKKK